MPSTHRSDNKTPLKNLGRLLAIACVTVWASTATAQTLSPEERLTAIRNKLMQVVLQGPIQVQSTSWIDAQGALQEANSFRSGMQVRGVRIMGYERDAQGEPQASMQIDNQTAVANKAKSELPNLQACPDNSKAGHLQHLVALQWSMPTASDSDDQHLLESLRTTLTTFWRQTASDATAWRLIEPQDSIAELSQSAYDNALLGSGLDHIPWQLKLTLQYTPQVQQSDIKSISVRLKASLTARYQAYQPLETSIAFMLQGERGNWGLPRIDDATQYVVRQQLGAWARTLQQNLACQAVRPQVTRYGDADIRINAGSASGVRPGDEWLLVDDRQFPGKLLENGVAAQSVLARVKSVAEHQAQLELLAGPVRSVQSRWRAMNVD